MARKDATHSPVSPIDHRVLLVTVAILLIIQGGRGQRVRVEPEVEAYPEGTVDLRCQFADGGTGTKLTQVSWTWSPEEGQKDLNIAVFHPSFGESFPDSPFSGRVVFTKGSLQSPSIRISRLTMRDAGRYTCEYATYPSGNEQGTTTLVMLAKPRNSASPVTVAVGSAVPVVVARCEAAEGKPAADIRWTVTAGDHGNRGNHSTASRPGADGTVTVTSVYKMAPVAADNGREVTCVVSQRTQDRPQSFSMRLNVEYPPTVTIEGYDDNWFVGRSDVTLTCQANANPAPTNVTWSSTSGPMPDTVQISGSRLTVRRVDDAVNTTFVCEVSNRLGASKHQITTMVIDRQKRAGGSSSGAIVGGVIAALVAVAAAVAAILFLRKRRMNGDGPPKHKPPPPVKTASSTEMLNKPAEPPVSTETEPLSNMYHETRGEPVTDLDTYDDEAMTLGGSANGGAPPGLEDSLPYDSAREFPPPDSAPDDGHYGDGEATPESPSATVARGESFVSPAMYV